MQSFLKNNIVFHQNTYVHYKTLPCVIQANPLQIIMEQHFIFQKHIISESRRGCAKMPQPHYNTIYKMYLKLSFWIDQAIKSESPVSSSPPHIPMADKSFPLSKSLHNLPALAIPYTLKPCTQCRPAMDNAIHKIQNFSLSYTDRRHLSGSAML